MTSLPRGAPLSSFLHAPTEGSTKLQLTDIMAASDLDFDLEVAEDEEQVKKEQEVTEKVRWFPDFF